MPPPASRALTALAERLGVSAPEPDSEFAFEIGLAAWASIGGARVAIAHGPLKGFVAILDRGRDGMAWMLARLRDPMVRADASGVTDRVGALASGPAGKVLGGCAAAALACTLGGVIGPGISSRDAGGATERPARTAESRSQSPADAASETLATSRSGESQPAPEHAPPEAQHQDRRQLKKARQRLEQGQVERQASGIARAAADSAAAPEVQASAVDSETVTVTPSEEGPSSSESAEKEFSFEQQP
jgi:hypothetical protein